MTITIRNHTNDRMLFSDFNAPGGGKTPDTGVPFDTIWIDPWKTGTLQTGAFSAVGVGAQVQSGGVWVVDPANPDSRALDGQHFTVTLTTKAE